MKHMSKEDFRAQLVPAIDEYLAASASKDAAARTIRMLVPYSNLPSLLDSPPTLCDACNAPGPWYGDSLCSGCKATRKAEEEQARIDKAVAERLAQAGGS